MTKWSVLLALLAVVLLATSAPAAVLLYEDFEDAPVGWQAFGEVMGEPISLWHGETYRSVSGDYSAAYNTGSGMWPSYVPEYSVEVGLNWGVLVSPAMDLSAFTNVYLDFYSWVDSGIDELALAVIGVDGDFVSPWLPINWTTPAAQWNHLYADLSGLAGLSDVRLGFLYENLTCEPDGCFAGEGWYIDDVRVRACGEPVPEPSTVMLLMSGLACIGIVSRKRIRK